MSFQIKTSSIFAITLLFSMNAQAQMLDSLSGLGIQGTLTNQSVKSVNQGLTYLQKTQILSQLNQMALEIKINYMNGYSRLSKNDFKGNPFSNMVWNVGPIGTSQFFIELQGVDRGTCLYLGNSNLETEKILVNNQSFSQNNCSKSNKMRFIFD